jgi:hypothetical protein
VTLFFFTPRSPPLTNFFTSPHHNYNDHNDTRHPSHCALVGACSLGAIHTYTPIAHTQHALDRE